MRSVVLIVLGGIAVVTGLGIASCAMEEAADEAGSGGMVSGGDGAPRFEVDPFWPKPLPNGWLLGSTIGVSVDSRDHVWIIHRQESLDPNTETNAAADPPTAACCSPAPPVLEFDPAGNLVGWWGGPGEGYDWPESNHGITVDPMDNVWIGGNGAEDSHVLKFTRDGRFLLQLGSPHMRTGSNDTENFWRVAKISMDPEMNEAYIADGYGNRRVAVVDMDTGETKRYWGAYGNRPDDRPLPPYDPSAPPEDQFRSPVHCADVSRDGLVYVCDRANDRIQVFQRDGTFVREVFVEPATLASGSVWDIAFSPDEDQRWLYLADGTNRRIYVLDRETLEIVTRFGTGGRQPGQFLGVHSIATDSQGNLYSTETWEGKRLQKFIFRGLGPVDPDQGSAWPGA